MLKVSVMQAGQTAAHKPLETTLETSATSSPARLVISATRKTSWFRSVPCYLVFHEQELILVHLDKRGTRQAVIEYRAEQKAQGKGYFAITIAMARFWRDYGDRYYDASRQDLLALHADNLAMPFATIQQFSFLASRRENYDDRSPYRSSQPSPGEIVIWGQAGKLKVQHNEFDRDRNMKRKLEELLGSRLTYKAS